MGNTLVTLGTFFQDKQLKKLPDKAAASGPQTLDVEKTRTGGTTLRSS